MENAKVFPGNDSAEQAGDDGHEVSEIAGASDLGWQPVVAARSAVGQVAGERGKTVAQLEALVRNVC